MSKPKTTKAAKRRSTMGLYRRVSELLKQPSKRKQQEGAGNE